MIATITITTPIVTYVAALLGLVGAAWRVMSYSDRFSSSKEALQEYGFFVVAVGTAAGFFAQAGGFGDIGTTITLAVGLPALAAVVVPFLLLPRVRPPKKVDGHGGNDEEGEHAEEGH